MSDHDYEVIQAMKRFGGSFVDALACAAQLADEENLRRIKATWPDLWEQYADMAQRAKEQRTA